MTTIDFYYDPSCPFSWITSRWLLQVSAEREISVTWRPFSLALKNNELEPKASEGKHTQNHRDAHRVLRVITAAEKAGASPLDIYSAIGTKFHVAGFPMDDEWIMAVLEELSLPTELLRAADDTQYDEFLQNEITSATDVAGNDIGVPTIVFSTAEGKQGYFGPILNELPELEESLQIWDGLEKLATVKAFYELKRSRPGGKPDIASTARC